MKMMKEDGYYWSYGKGRKGWERTGRFSSEAEAVNHAAGNAACGQKAGVKYQQEDGTIHIYQVTALGRLEY